MENWPVLFFLKQALDRGESSTVLKNSLNWMETYQLLV